MRARLNHGESGFTLIELLVVILIIGILAAIAIPSFLNQRSKGNDAEAKSTAVTAAEAFETCADRQQRFVHDCSTALGRSSPRSTTPARAGVTPGASDYHVIVVTSNRDSNAAKFTLSRSSTGPRSRTCATGTADKGGCSAQTNGTW